MEELVNIAGVNSQQRTAEDCTSSRLALLRKLTAGLHRLYSNFVMAVVDNIWERFRLRNQLSPDEF
jgi:hypothetical protein